MINPTTLKTIATYAPKVSKAAKALVAAPNIKATFTIGQAKVMSKVLPESAGLKEFLKAFSQIGEALAGKKATLTVSKEASKYTKGASVVRASIGKGKQKVIALAAKIDPKGTVPTLQMGASLPGSSAYGKLNLNELGMNMFDDLGISLSKKGDVIKYAANIGEVSKGAATVNPKEYLAYLENIAPKGTNPDAPAMIQKIKSAISEGKQDIGKAIEEVKSALAGKVAKQPDLSKWTKKSTKFDPKAFDKMADTIKTSEVRNPIIKEKLKEKLVKTFTESTFSKNAQKPKVY